MQQQWVSPIVAAAVAVSNSTHHSTTQSQSLNTKDALVTIALQSHRRTVLTDTIDTIDRLSDY